MEDNKFQREVLDRLIALEILIKGQDYKEVKRVSDEADNRSKNNEERLNKIEDNQKWLVRLVLGALVLGIIGFFYKI